VKEGVAVGFVELGFLELSEDSFVEWQWLGCVVLGHGFVSVGIIMPENRIFGYWW